MYYDKHLFEHLVRECVTPAPLVWTQLQAARQKQAESRIDAVQALMEKTEAKLVQAKKKLKLATKTLADCQAQLIQRDRQLCVCKIKTLKVPAK